MCSETPPDFVLQQSGGPHCSPTDRRPRALGTKTVINLQQASGSIMRYKVVLQKSEEGYSVSCPGLPGCWSQGTTEAEALQNIQDAIREYLAAIDDILQATPDAEVREVEVVV
jgi:predicted RNase H-like HicB family nuclease